MFHVIQTILVTFTEMMHVWVAQIYDQLCVSNVLEDNKHVLLLIIRYYFNDLLEYYERLRQPPVYFARINTLY